MDTIKKIFLSTVSITIVVGLVTLFTVFYRRVNTVVEDIDKKAEQDLYDISIYSVTRFDGSVIYGSQAITYVKEYFTFFEEIVLINDGGVGSIVTDTVHFRDVDSPFYINGNATYKLSLVYNANEIPVKCTITKQ